LRYQGELYRLPNEPSRSPLTDLSHPGIQRVVEVASRKGVALEIKLLARSAHTPEEAAAAVDAELAQMVRSLVFVAPRPFGRLAPIVCLVSGRQQADPAALAAAAGEVAVRHATDREAHELTGYPIGGIPPFGHGRDVRVLMDQDLGRHQWVWAAAGADAALFQVAPGTLRMLSNAIVAPLVQA
jgi:prolyl-tRNA editing enzyme YbaK/EbsC (Cys-tRNA(Pro) deacylase)